MKMLDRAIKLAHEAHEGQVRKGNGEPYINHPMRVLRTMQDLDLFTPAQEDELCAAVLHDVIEDCPQVTKELIVDRTSQYTLKLVQALTNPTKDSRLPREMKKEIDRYYLSKAPLMARRIKLADRIDNILDIRSLDRDFQLLYARESFLLLDVLRETNFTLETRLEHAIYELLKG